MNKDGKGFEVSRTAAEKDPVLSPDAVAQALIDYDGDGDLDVVQVRASGRLQVLRNDLPSKGASAFIRLQGPAGNRLAVGALVTGKVGALLVSRHVGTVAYGGAGMGRVHFGLADAKAVTDLTVTWPDGKVTQVPSLKAGQNVLVKYP